MPRTVRTGSRAWHLRILLANERAVRLVEPGAAVVHGDRHHGIRAAVAAHLHTNHIMGHVDLTELDFRIRVQRNPLTRPFSDYHFYFLSGILFAATCNTHAATFIELQNRFRLTRRLGIEFKQHTNYSQAIEAIISSRNIDLYFL